MTPRHRRASPTRRHAARVGAASLPSILALAQSLTYSPSADAAVAVNGNNVSYSVADCTVTVGDKADPHRFGIGDSEVSCRSRHTIGLYTQLTRNGKVVAASGPPRLLSPTDHVERPTNVYSRCNGPALWETTAWVWIPGQQRPLRLVSRTAPWTPC